jgi:hypothetical protein
MPVKEEAAPSIPVPPVVESAPSTATAEGDDFF